MPDQVSLNVGDGVALLIFPVHRLGRVVRDMAKAATPPDAAQDGLLPRLTFGPVAHPRCRDHDSLRRRSEWLRLAVWKARHRVPSARADEGSLTPRATVAELKGGSADARWCQPGHEKRL